MGSRRNTGTPVYMVNKFGTTNKKRPHIVRIVLWTLLVLVVLLNLFRLWQAKEATRLAISRLSESAPPPTSDGTHPCVFATVIDDTLKPTIGRCATPTTHSGAVDRFEVDLRYGTFVLRQTDLRMNDVFDVPLTRSYTSDDWLPKNEMHAFGRNSNHPYDVAPLGTRFPYTYMMLALEDGDFLYFDRISRGTGYADAVYQHTETSTRFYKSTISWNGNGWTLRLVGGGKVLFPESYNATNLAQGAATEIRDPRGNRLELRRDKQRNLQEILTPHGHWIRFAYDRQSRVVQATDNRGNSVRYEYSAGPDGVLLSVLNSFGSERHYQYQGKFMTAILDAHNHVLLRNVYRSGVLVEQTYSNGDVYKYHYFWHPKLRDSYYADKVVISMPNQKVQEVGVGNSVPRFLRR